MLALSSIAVAGLVAVTYASPTLHNGVTPRDNCKGDTSSQDGVQAILDSTGFDDQLDIYLSSFWQHETDWVDSYWNLLITDGGTSPLSGCGLIGSDCEASQLCSDYPTENEYWVIRSVTTLHSKMNALHDLLLWNGWLSGLSIDQIGKDFTVSGPDLTWAKWLSAAFSMAGGIATGVALDAGLRGMVGFTSGAFSATAADGSVSGDAVDTTSVENTLANLIGNAGNYVSQILYNATGNGDATTLPIYTDTTLQYATARFFADNSILLDQNKDNSTMMAAWSHFGTNIEKKLVDVAMKTAYYMAIEDTDVTSSDDCAQYYPGSAWIDNGHGTLACFYLTRPGADNDCSDGDPQTCVLDSWQAAYGNNQFDKGVYDKLTNTYGYDLAGYYADLIDCQLNGNGTPDLTFTTAAGNARCFYSGFVRSISWGSDGTALPLLYISDL